LQPLTIPARTHEEALLKTGALQHAIFNSRRRVTSPK
jgi:hypothetical protein